MMGEGRKMDRKRARGRKRLVKEYGRERESWGRRPDTLCLNAARRRVLHICYRPPQAAFRP